MKTKEEKQKAIDQLLIEKYKKRTIKPDCYIKYTHLNEISCTGKFVQEETNFHVWKKPEVGKKYIASCDVSRGDGNDYCTIQILDIESLEQCAEYRDNIPTNLFSHIIDWAARQYNEALVVIEANSFGLAVCFDMREKRHYKHLFYSKNIQKMQARGGDCDFSVDEGVRIPGFQTANIVRPMVVNNLKIAMQEDAVNIHSARLMSEINSFIIKNDMPQADKGCNDDLVMAICVGLYIISLINIEKEIPEKQKVWNKIIEILQTHGSNTIDDFKTLSNKNELPMLEKELINLIDVPITFINLPSTRINDEGVEFEQFIQTNPIRTEIDEFTKQARVYTVSSRILKSYEDFSLIKSYPFVYIYSITLNHNNTLLIRLIEHNFGKKKVTFTISENIYSQFIEKADSLAINKSKFVENRIIDFLKNN